MAVREEDLNAAQKVYIQVAVEELKQALSSQLSPFEQLEALVRADDAAYEAVALCDHDREQAQAFIRESLKEGARRKQC